MDARAIRLKNLRRLVREAETVAALAERVGSNSAYLSRILTQWSDERSKPRGVGNALARRLEQAMGKPHGWMDHEHDMVRDGGLPVPDPAGNMGDASNIEPAPDGHQDRGRSVPLISWANASFGLQAHDHLEPGDAHRWVRCDRPCSRYTYALTVRGDSMWPVYMENDIIFVDPERQPEHNKDVVVRNSATDDVTLKRFVQDGTRAYLKALNKDYPEPIRLVSEEDRFCGVVIQMKRDM